MKPVVLLPQAENDIRQVALDYEKRAAGLADALFYEIRQILTHIEQSPRLYARVDTQVRRAALGRFPFGIFYYEGPDTVRVIAVLNLRRDPVRLGNVLGNRVTKEAESD